MEWLLTNLDNISYAFSGLVLTASVIVKMTKTKKDDEILGKIRNGLERFSLIKKDVVDANKDA